MDSYEMTSQPSYGSLNGAPQRQGSNGYVAFNPGMQNGQQRSATAPSDMKGQGGYEDIIDDYSGQRTYGEGRDGIRRVSPPSGPARAYTAGPEGGGGRHGHGRF